MATGASSVGEAAARDRVSARSEKVVASQASNLAQRSSCLDSRAMSSIEVSSSSTSL